MPLSPAQQNIVDLAVQGKNVFFTGSAGTGKSLVTREIIRELRQKYDYEQVSVTAPTGVAASNVNGCTIHLFVGCGLASEPADVLVNKITRNRRTLQRWKVTKVLIIDEISMVDGEFFDKLERVARCVRQSKLPFGGIQLITCGDFMQLPPVKKSLFAFEAEAWNICYPDHKIVLTEIFRQRDPLFTRILNEIRLGKVTDESENIIKSLCRELDVGLDPTELYSLRNEVDESNKRKLTELVGKEYHYDAIDSGDVAKLKDMLAPVKLTIKVGAQVMLVKNTEDTDLVNGTVGRVVSINSGGWPVVDFLSSNKTWRRGITIGPEKFTMEKDSIIFASRVQVPLVLAYAMSIHKSQGQTLTVARVDLGKVFEMGQAYVALSRATSLETLQVVNFCKDRVRVNPKVVEFYRNLVNEVNGTK